MIIYKISPAPNFNLNEVTMLLENPNMDIKLQNQHLYSTFQLSAYEQ